MDEQISYFAAGPAKLPPEVLKEIQKELIHYKDTKVSVMELSHRSKDFEAIIQEAESLIKELLHVPDNYKILFMQGGATAQFSAVPLNLNARHGRASFFVTGYWSKKALLECQKYINTTPVYPIKGEESIPSQLLGFPDHDSGYLYYCANETIEGIEFQSIPDSLENIPLICDMSSNFFSRTVDVSKFGLIFGSAQKNLGCAGITVVIIREDLFETPNKACPAILNYGLIAKNNSLLNTPPTFAVYVLGKVLSWIKREGGVAAMEERAILKSSILYSLIDSSDGFYHNPVIEKEHRSRMNVIFRVGGPSGDEALEKKFLEEAKKKGLLSLKGHRSVGGMRASIYNAVSVDDVRRLADFMSAFQKEHKLDQCH